MDRPFGLLLQAYNLESGGIGQKAVSRNSFPLSFGLPSITLRYKILIVVNVLFQGKRKLNFRNFGIFGKNLAVK